MAGVNWDKHESDRVSLSCGPSPLTILQAMSVADSPTHYSPTTAASYCQDRRKQTCHYADYAILL